MVEKRLSSLSKSKEIFENEKRPYEEALKQSGYDLKLSYQPTASTKKKRNRQRKIIWFNPPFSESVSTNIGRDFIKIVEKNFPQNHRYHKIFNKNTVKVSYSCMKNMEQIIKSHNTAILNPKKSPEAGEESCNCRDKKTCPLNGKCLSSSLTYEGTLCDTLANTDEKFKYIGLVKGVFKNRFDKHTLSFRNEKYSNTTLSRKVWEIKRNGGAPKVTWKILKFARSYQNGQRQCDLCLTEKLLIMKCKDKNLLNSRSEINSKCRHKRKFLLGTS